MLALNENLRLMRMARLVSDRESVIDIGSAAKPNSYLLNKRVVALDLEPHPMPANYFECRTGDAMKLPEPFEAGEFDAIVAGEIIEHLEDPVRFLRLCWETLAPDGVLVLSTPNPNSPIERLLTLTLSRRFYYTNDHIMLFPQRWLIRMLERVGFSDVELYSGGFPFPIVGLIPFPRPWCYQTIARAIRRKRA